MGHPSQILTGVPLKPHRSLPHVAILPNLLSQDCRYINRTVLYTISSPVGVKVISGVQVRNHEVRVSRIGERSVEISDGNDPWELRSGSEDPGIQRPALRRTWVLRARIDVTGVRIGGRRQTEILLCSTRKEEASPG